MFQLLPVLQLLPVHPVSSLTLTHLTICLCTLLPPPGMALPPLILSCPFLIPRSQLGIPPLRKPFLILPGGVRYLSGGPQFPGLFPVLFGLLWLSLSSDGSVSLHAGLHERRPILVITQSNLQQVFVQYINEWRGGLTWMRQPSSTG